MTAWEVTGTGVRATDDEQSSVRVSAPDWAPGGDPPALPTPVDATVAGTVTELGFPPAHATLTPLDGGPATAVEGEHRIEGPHALDVAACLDVVARFAGPATARRTDGDRVRLTFEGPTAVRLGCRTDTAPPPSSVRVPPTPEGLATAVTHAAAPPFGPERSRPTRRPHPPLLTFGETRVPPAVAETTPDADAELVVPADRGDVLSAAPLAYYLGARLRARAGADPTLRAPGVERSLDPLTRRVPALLRQLLWFDCLLRADGVAVPPGLADRGLDPAWAAGTTPAERLARRLELEDGVVPSAPEWHLAVYVEPTPANARALPHLLDRLAAVYPPSSTDLSGRELMERSLDAFFRGRRQGEVPTVDVVKPALRDARLHGWLAEGTPIDVFKATAAAFEHRLDYRDWRGRDGIDVTVVLNDEEMADEHAAVASVYREAEGTRVAVRRRLRRSDLGAVFAAGNDLVHFIGHCETGGLVCPDGTLAAADLEENTTRAFFLNACGSYYEGLDLVRAGSVAGGVTYREVLDDQAATVGETVARLLVDGFSVERAVSIARRRIMMGKDYAVVGDGTLTLRQSGAAAPVLTHVEPAGNRYVVTCEPPLEAGPGGYYRARVPAGESATRRGSPVTVTLDRAALRSHLEGRPKPVVFDGQFRWSDDLAASL